MNMVAIVNDYFVNLLEMGSHAANAELVHLTILTLPSKYIYPNTNPLTPRLEKRNAYNQSRSIL